MIPAEDMRDYLDRLKDQFAEVPSLSDLDSEAARERIPRITALLTMMRIRQARDAAARPGNP